MVKLKVWLALAGLTSAKSVDSRIVCDNGSLSIRCPAGFKIRIRSAFYGRFASDKCITPSSKGTTDTSCSLNPGLASQVLSDRCNDQSACVIDVEKTMKIYQDPCPATTKYLEYSYECVKSAFECPGAVMAAVFTKDHFTSYRQDGGWTTDAMDDASRVYYLPWDQSGAAEIKEFRNMEDLQHSQQLTYYRLDDKADGTGFVVRDRKLYYNKRQSRELIMFDLERRYQELSVTLPDANYYDTSPYSIEKNTDIDLAVDEQGLWAIYATERNQGRIVISKLDPQTLKIINTWETSIEKTSVLEGWMTCGVFYAVQADSENLLFIFDTNNNREIRGPEATRITIPELPESTTSIKYDPRARALQIWSLGQMISYQLRFQPMSALYPTTTTKKMTTKSTTTTRQPTTATEIDLTNVACPKTEIYGLEFPETKWNSQVVIKCPDSAEMITWSCRGSPRKPEWETLEPNYMACTSPWIRDLKPTVDRKASYEGLKQSTILRYSLQEQKDSLKQFDSLAVLDLVQVIHDQNPKLSDKTLEENLIKVIDILLASSSSGDLATTTKTRQTELLQSLLSRLSCKLRMGKSYYEFVDSSDLAIYLEPVESEASKFPIEISFPEDTSSSSYRSLIRLNPHQAGSEYLGSLHSDCERPVSNYQIEYTFPAENGACADRGEKCRSLVVENMTRCVCPPEAGFVTLNYVDHAPYIDVTENDVNTKQAVILAVFIFSALLHGAAFISSLLLDDSGFIQHEGLNSGLQQSHRAINLCIMITLISMAASAEMVFENEMFCSVVSVVLHFLCISSFVWATIRPLFLSMFTLSHERKLISGCWLTTLVVILSILITAASTTISLFASESICMTESSIGFTWSAAVIAIVLGLVSMLLVCLAAVRLRDGVETFETHRVRSTLAWTSTFTIFLCCEWALVFLWLSASEQRQLYGTLLAAVALIHASLNFINGCICNAKAQHGWRSALARFGIRGQEEKSEFYWTRAPDGRDEFTIRPQGMKPPPPDCVQMTYGQSSSSAYDPSTMQLSQSQYSASSREQWAAQQQTQPQQFVSYPYNTAGHMAVYNQNHPIVNQSLQRDASNFNDFRPAGSEFEFSRGSSQPFIDAPHDMRQPFLQQQNYDAEV